ncbi:MAG: hypothetical protein AAF570_22885 [Bacteroidota bacterium]
MKKSILKSFGKLLLTLLCAVLFSANGAWAQNVDNSSVPANAKRSFASSHPGITPTWKAGPDGAFEAHYEKAGKQQAFVYTAGGALQQKKFKSPETAIPINIRNAVAEAHPGQPFESAYRVMTRDKRRFYEVRVEDASNLHILQYSVSGNPIASHAIALGAPAVTPESVATAEAVTTSPDPADLQPEGETIAMRGEATTTVAITEDIDLDADLDEEAEMMDSDIADLFSDDEEPFEMELETDSEGWEALDKIEDALWEVEEEDWEAIDPY